MENTIEIKKSQRDNMFIENKCSKSSKLQRSEMLLLGKISLRWSFDVGLDISKVFLKQKFWFSKDV